MGVLTSHCYCKGVHPQPPYRFCLQKRHPFTVGAPTQGHRDRRRLRVPEVLVGVLLTTGHTTSPTSLRGSTLVTGRTTSLTRRPSSFGSRSRGSGSNQGSSDSESRLPVEVGVGSSRCRRVMARDRGSRVSDRGDGRRGQRPISHSIRSRPRIPRGGELLDCRPSGRGRSRCT